MTEIFIDIENTVIDDLGNCRWLNEQSGRIMSYVQQVVDLVTTHGNNEDVKVSLFTWGWRTKEEVRDYIVKWIFDSLEIPPQYRGRVWTKDDSIECAYKHKWVNTTDEMEIEDLHIPGSMKRYGLDKQMCFVQQVRDLAEESNCSEFILIDDTNPRWHETRHICDYHEHKEVIITFEHPEEL